MSGNIENVNINKTSSATLDDSWVICDSSSYPGMKFYVNKVTGIKVWNITDSEIAFAERASKDSPEPQRHPTMDHSPKDARIYNKQIINNQFSNQLSNLLVNSVPACPFNVWDNPQNQPPQIQRQQTYTLVPTALAQAVQQLLPLANSLQNTSLPVSYNAQQYAQNQRNPIRISKSAKYRKNKWKRERYDLNQTSQNQFVNTHDNSDLRRRLVRRKSCSETFSRNDREDCNEQGSSIWHDKNNWNNQGWGETSTQMNLAPLKSMTSSYSDSKHWYIVVDTDVILKNYNYLNDMTAADPDFHLLIPHHVMSELRLHVLESSNVQDRRTLRFLKDQIDSGQAVLGQKEEGDSAAYLTMTTCINLASQNNHVILITNNAETFKYKSITKDINVFTMQEIKDILANRPTRLPRPNSPTLAVRITVPNDVADKNVSHKDYPEITSPRKFDFTKLTETSAFTESALGQSMENSQARNRSPQNPVAKEKAFAGTSVSTRSVLGHSPVNSKADNLSPSKSIGDPEFSDINVRSKSALGVYSRNYKAVISPTKSVATDGYELSDSITPSKSAIGDYSVENSNAVRDQHISKSVPKDSYELSNTSIPSESAIRMYSAENVKAVRDKNPLKSVAKDSYEFSNTNISSESAIRMYSAENVKDFRDLNLSKSVANDRYELSNTIPSERAIGEYSAENDKTIRDQSPLKSVSKDGCELSDSDIPTKCAIGVYSVNSEAVRCQRPSKSVDYEFSNTRIRSQNALGKKSIENTKVDSNQSPTKSTKGSSVRNTVQNKSPAKMSDDSSLCSSPLSSHVSLDTIRMKRIISMKRLPSTENSLKQKGQAKSITSNDKASIKSADTPRTTHRTSLSISESYDNTSDVSVVKSNVRENIVVEETSTSGVISNSESSHSDKVSPFKQDLKKFGLRNVVMYGIGCQSMEDVLRTRWDEWVFRFVQIMEEVLRVKLQEKLPFDDKKYPAPRDLKEAARCIIKKFSNNFNVVDAANKLSFILCKMSDEHGKIAVNVEPSDYMEMYSYGVFLVETFQDMISDCKEKDCKKEKTNKAKEDKADSCSCYEVNNASESMKKLLYDIQNANLESFVDHPRDLSTENTNPDNSDLFDYEMDAREELQVTETPYYDEIQCDDNIMHNLYNLRSHKRKSQYTEDDEVLPKVTATCKGIESEFFKSLELKKTFLANTPECLPGVKDSINDKQNALKNISLCHSTEQGQPPNEPRNEHLHNLKIHFSKDDFNAVKLPSKVVCNFSVNADIERRVNARRNEMEYEEDYGENHLDYEDDNFEDGIVDEMPPESESAFDENNTERNGDSNLKFKSFMGRLSRRLGDVFTQVKLLCNEYAEEVKCNLPFEPSKRNELHHKVEMAYSLIGDICCSLDSISKRDQDKDTNIQMLLKIAKVQDFIPDYKLCLEYRYMINKCKVNAEEIQNIVRNVLTVVRG